MHQIRFIIGAELLLVTLAIGCAPREFAEGVPWTIRAHRRSDAKSQTIRGMPYLRVNAFLLDELKTAVQTDDAAAAGKGLRSAVEQCHRLARSCVANEIDRLSPSALGELWKRYFAAEARPPDVRKEIRARYLRIVEAAYGDFLSGIESRKTIHELRALVEDIAKRVGPSPKDKHGGGLALALAAGSAHEYRGVLDKGGPRVDLYVPDQQSLDDLVGAGAKEAGSLRALLGRYAPTIVQERVDQAGYEPSADMIGTVKLGGRWAHIKVVVEPGSPSIYAYWQYTKFRGRRYIQLVYTYWYPRRPALKPFDPEAGPVDGATLRITLDSGHRPALFETMLNCGCYHRCYPAGRLEAAARRAYGAPVSGKKLCIERGGAGPFDWIVPETVKVPAGSGGRPILFSRAGYHGPAGVSFDSGELSRRTVLHRMKYALRPYEVLERLPMPDGFGSMFGPDGLVDYAGRPEGWLLAGTGMLSAGQPRQRGTQRICWDYYDFDDPHLLEKALRLPPDF